MNLPADHKKNYHIKPYVTDIQYTLPLALTHTPFQSISIPVSNFRKRTAIILCY